MDLLIFALASFGGIYLITASAIFAPIRIPLASRSRVLEVFLYCAYCVGFWIGFGQQIAWSDLDWAWTLNDLLVLVDALTAGCVVMGLVAVGRAIAPTFLEGAWEYDREGIELLRSRQDGEEHGAGEGSTEDS